MLFGLSVFHIFGHYFFLVLWFLCLVTVNWTHNGSLFFLCWRGNTIILEWGVCIMFTIGFESDFWYGRSHKLKPPNWTVNSADGFKSKKTGILMSFMLSFCVCCRQPRWRDLPRTVLPAYWLLYFRGSPRNGFSRGEHPCGQAGSGHLWRRLWEVWAAGLGCGLKVRFTAASLFLLSVTSLFEMDSGINKPQNLNVSIDTNVHLWTHFWPQLKDLFETIVFR